MGVEGWPYIVSKRTTQDNSQVKGVGGDFRRGREAGVKGVGSLQEVGEERAGSGIPKVAGTRRNRKKFCNMV